MIYGYEDIFTIGLAIISFVIVIVAQIKVTGAFNKYKNIESKKKLSGVEVARAILDKNNLANIHVVEVKGELTDHYDPSRKVVRLSTPIFHGTSIAALSVAAHEVGHALQDKDNYTAMRVRSALVPFVNFISKIGYFSIIISLIAGITTYLLVGIIVLLATLVFQLITLPVEFNASKRAKEEIVGLSLVDDYELSQSNDMLNAAALTYVASLISTVLSLLRLILMSRRDD